MSVYYIIDMNVLQSNRKLICKTAKNCTYKILKKNISSTEYCLDTIKCNDYENYVCTLLLNNKARTNGIVIRAFNVELARVHQQISNSNTGLMRLQFWEDALNSCFTMGKKVPKHPIASELKRIIQSNKFTKRYFQSLILSRKNLLVSNSIPTLNAMEKYAEESVSCVFYLLLEGSGIRNIHADHAASHLGKAQGICQFIRSIPHMKPTSNFIPIPQELLTEYKISHESIKRQKINESIKECIFQIATRANQQLEKARSLHDNLSDEAKTVLLPATIIDNYLQKLLKVDCDIFNPSLQQKNLLWIPTIWWKNVIRTY